jgi:hypothetical protein
MNNRPGKYYTLLYRAAFIVGCFFVASCENTQAEIDDLTKGVESYLSQDGSMRAKLTSPLMYRVVDSGYVEFPKTLHVDFYNDSLKVESWLDARYGKYLERLDKVYLRDSVILISIQGDTLKCQDLWWDQNSRLFYTDKYAEYHAKDKNILGGKGMEATQDMTTVTFKEPTGSVDRSNDNGLQ